MTEKLKNLREKWSKFFSNAGKVAIILLSMVVGFYVNEIYRARKSKPSSTVTEERMPKAKSQQETSVAINERGEIIVIDRNTGKYEIYADSVGLMIFNHYASRMYVKANQK
jgi:hypothetical protein